MWLIDVERRGGGYLAAKVANWSGIGIVVLWSLLKCSLVHPQCGSEGSAAGPKGVQWARRAAAGAQRLHAAEGREGERSETVVLKATH